MVFFKVLLSVIFILLFLMMMGVLVAFERKEPKHFLFWTVVFLLFQIVGYFAYLIIKIAVKNRYNRLLKKADEDKVYYGLSEKYLKNINSSSNNEIMQFGERFFNSPVVKNSALDIFDDYQKFEEVLVKDIKSSTEFILLELNKVDSSFEKVKDALVEKAESGVSIKLSYTNHIPNKMLKMLKKAGVKCYKFNKFNGFKDSCSNLRNLICVDGKMAYIGEFLTINKNKTKTFENETFFYRLRGDLVQNANILLHQDIMYTSGKHIEYSSNLKEILSDDEMELISNQINIEMESYFLKAVTCAKKSIQMQLTEFIPTDSIMSLIKFAISSNIDVRIMLPMKNKHHMECYASRANAKDLALLGANVYLFDGYISSNIIVVDDEVTIMGCYKINKNYINDNLQTVLTVNDKDVVSYFNKVFNKDIDNSYRINNAKFLLLKEKIFRNLV